MRDIGMLHPTSNTPMFPENVGIAVISTAGAIVAQDYPDGARFMHIDAPAAFWIHPTSTAVAIGTTSQVGSTSQNLSMRFNQGHEVAWQIIPGSTGYSITSETSGVISIGFWK